MKPGERFSPYKRFRNIYIPLGIAASTKLPAAAKLTYGALARRADPNGKRRPEYWGVAGLAISVSVLLLQFELVEQIHSATSCR